MNIRAIIQRFLRYTGTAAVIFLAAAVFSCSVRQDVALTRQGSGTADITIKLRPMLIRYFKDLLEFAGDENPEAIFNEAAIRQAFREIPELTLQDVNIPDSGELQLSVAFADIENAFFKQIGSGVTPVAEIEDDGTTGMASLRLDPENYNKIVERMLVLTGMSVFDDYLGALLEPGPRDIILDIYEYAFEDYVEDESVEEILRQSSIVCSFTVPGGIESRRGGRLNGKTITYSIPLMDILTIENPIEYHFYFH